MAVKLHSAEEANVQLYSLVAGESFGEMALVDAQQPTHYVTYLTETHTELLMVGGADPGLMGR